MADSIEAHPIDDFYASVSADSSRLVAKLTEILDRAGGDVSPEDMAYLSSIRQSLGEVSIVATLAQSKQQ